MLRNSSQAVYTHFQLARKAKIWKPALYQAIPHYMVPELRDPHDEYQLRNKTEIQKQLAVSPPKFRIEISALHLPDYMGYQKHYNRKIKFQVKIEDMNLTQMQRARLIVMLGSRYKNNDILKFSVDMYPTFEENVEKGMEMFKEMYLEALRAP